MDVNAALLLLCVGSLAVLSIMHGRKPPHPGRVDAPEPPPVDPEIAARPNPSLGLTVAVLTVPILLLLTQTVAELMFEDKTGLRVAWGLDHVF